jgi:hypothetical protein
MPTSSSSASTRLPPTEHRAVAASLLRAAAPPPLVQATGFQRAACTLLVVMPLHLFAPCSSPTRGHLCCPRAPPSQTAAAPPSSLQVTNIRAWSSSTRRVLPLLYQAPPLHFRRQPAWPLLAGAGLAAYPSDSLGIQHDPFW